MFLHRRVFCCLFVLVGVVVATFPPLGLANPSGESVAAGNANFQRNGASLTIHTGVRTIINWQDFSIGSGETTKFIQHSASSITLNRVVSENPSSILGNLQSNGNVWLINPNGVLVGKGARIDTAGFLASTLGTSDAEFLKGGDVKFVGSSSAKVTNQGSINAIGGDVFLIARQVENSGSITAARGTVGLAAGQEVLLKQAGQERVFVRPSGASGGGTGVDNSGSINAVQAELKAHGNIYALAINNSGVVRANTAVSEGGRILLKSGAGRTSKISRPASASGNGGRIVLDGGAGGVVNHSGTLDATGKAHGKRGGDIAVLGDRINVAGGLIDASGDAGGGRVRIGGGAHGKATVRNAITTTIGADAKISADAIRAGDGGKVVVWSDDTTIFDGAISAHGGSLRGNGGFVEVSGKGHLGFHGTVDAGATGTILLDPRDITITAAGSDNSQVSDGRVLFADGTPAATTDFSISNTALTALTGNIVLQAQQDITLQSGAPLNLTHQVAGNRFVLQAGRHITLNSAVTTAGADLYFEADSPYTGSAFDGVGTLTVAATVTTKAGGFIQLLGADFSFTSTIDSGYRRSTRVASSMDGADFSIGGIISNASIDNLISTYQVWLGKAQTAGSNGTGTGAFEPTAGNLLFSSPTILHNHAPVLFFSKGDVNINQSLTTTTQTVFQASNAGSLSFRVADGATFTNTSGGLQIENLDVVIDTTAGGGGYLNVASQLSIGATEPVSATFQGLAVGQLAAGQTIASNRMINVSTDELARMTAGRLQLYTNHSDITVDGVDATSVANIDSVAVSAGASHQAGVVRFENNPSSFKALSVVANGGIEVNQALTVATGAVNFNADRFGENSAVGVVTSGIFSNTASITSGGNQPVTIVAASVVIGAPLVTTGALTLLPSSATELASLGTGVDGFSVSSTDIANAGSGFASITLGGYGWKNTVNISDAAFSVPVTIQGGILNVAGPLVANGGATLIATVLTKLGSDISTLSAPITIKGPVTLTGNSVLDTSGGAAISFTGAINDLTRNGLNPKHDLTLNAPNNAITLNSVGATAGIHDFSVTGAAIKLAVAKTNGAQTYNGDLTLGGVLQSNLPGAGSSAIVIGGNLVLFANGVLTTRGAVGDDILISGAITGAHALSLGAGNFGDITVANSGALPSVIGTDATPLLTFTTTSATLTLNGSLWVGGALSLTTKTGDITNGGRAWTVGGRTTLNASTLHDIAISGAGNSFGTLALTARSVSLTENAASDLGASSVIGAFTLTSVGAITDSGNFTIGGAASFTSTLNDAAITLDSRGDRVLGVFTASTAGVGNVTLFNVIATQLGGGSYHGDLTVRSGGSITQTATLAVDGAAKFTTTVASSSITLNDAANDFGTLGLFTGNTATVSENSDTIFLGGAVRNAFLFHTAGGITQTGDLAVGNSTFVSTAARADLVFDRAGNIFSGIVNATTNGDVTLANSAGSRPGTRLGNWSVGGNVLVQSAGAITQTGAVSIIGDSNFTTTGVGSGIVLANAANSFTGKVALNTPGAASLVNSIAHQFDTSSVGGNLTLKAGGAVTQSGALDVGGIVALNSTGAITLDHSANSLVTLGAITRGGALSIVDSAGGLTLAGSEQLGAVGNDVTIVTKNGDLMLNFGVIIAGQNITLAVAPVAGVTSGRFLNFQGASALNLSGGRFLIYSVSPELTNRGALPFQFALFNRVYGDVIPPDYSGNGFIYSSDGTDTPP